MKPLVSILIPAYNAERFLADAIRSALCQTWQRREVIVVDDGSTDRTLSIAEQFVREGVQVVSQPHQGASAARNTALGLSRGDYLQWLDADDLLSPDKLSTQVNVLSEPGITRRSLISGAWGTFFYRTDKTRFLPTPLWRDQAPVEWLLTKIGQNYHMQPGTWLVSRELTDCAGPWDTRLWKDNDGEYFCRVIRSSDRIRFVPNAKVFYRSSGVNCVSYVGRSNIKLESMLLSIKLHLGYLRELENSERVRAACLNYLQNRLVYFYVARPDLAAELQLLAASLGGQLEPPRLPLKYEAVNKALGREAAYRVWSSAPIVKQSLIRSWDQALHRLESWERNRPTDREETSRNSDTSLKQLSLHSLKLSSLMGAILDAAYNFWV